MFASADAAITIDISSDDSSGVFMIISSIEDSVVFKRIFDHLDQRAEKQPLAYDWPSERHQHARSTCSRSGFRVL